MESLCPSVLVSVCPYVLILSGWYLLNCSNFVTRLGMVVQHHDLEGHAERLVCWLQGHSEGLHLTKIWVSTVSSELLIPFQPNLVWWYIILSQNVWWEYWIAVFKVKVTAKVQIVMECLSCRYLLNRWTFCDQTWCDEALSWAWVSCWKICVLTSRSRS